MKKIISAGIVIALIISFVSILNAQEQQPGQPLYFNREDVKEHKSDLAPHTDPHWQQEKERYRREGRPIKDMYDEPTETIYERETTIKRIDGGGSSYDDNSSSPGSSGSSKKPPTRWGN